MTTPGPTLEERVTILETRFDAILPTLATKEDIARLDGKIDAMSERLDGKIDAMSERLDGKIDAMSERLDGKIDAMSERLDGKIDTSNERIDGRFDTVNKRIDAIEYRMLIKFTSAVAAIVAIGVAVTKFL